MTTAFALLSDLHGHLPRNVPDSDAVIIAGDICPDRDQVFHLNTLFRQWAHNLNRPIFATLGNHDFVKHLPDDIANVTWLMDNSCVYHGIKLYGTPWTPQFGRWAYMKPDNKLTPIYENIDDDTRILVTHGPPHRHCDANRDGFHCGSLALARRLSQLAHCTHVVCGHIHEARGISMLTDTACVFNASYLDVAYQPYQHAIPVIEVAS